MFNFNPHDYALREILQLLGSVSIYLAIRFYAELLSAFGMHSPIRTREAFKKMARRLVQSMGKLDASRVLLFRTSNGESYVLGDFSGDAKIKTIFSYASDGSSEIPKYAAQDRALQILLLIEHSFSPEKIFYTNELRSDFLKAFLFEHDIEAFCLVKILDETKTKLYGFCVYSWSNVRTIPNKPGTDKLRDKEYIDFIAVYIKEKFIEIIQYSAVEKIKNFFKKSKYRIRIYRKWR